MRTRFGFGQVPAYITVFQRIRINKYSIFRSYYTNIYYAAIYRIGFQRLKVDDFHRFIFRTIGMPTYECVTKYNMAVIAATGLFPVSS